MSADNGWIIRQNKRGRYTLQMYFDSDNTFPPVEEDPTKALMFNSLEKTISYYNMQTRHGGMDSEYGLTVDVNSQKKEKKMSMEIKQFVRKRLNVEGVQVTDANIAEVADWCGGDLHNGPKGQFIKVNVRHPQSDRQTKAFVGDWVLRANTGFKVYTDTAMAKAFDKDEDEGYGRVDAAARINVERPTNIFDQSTDLSDDPHSLQSRVDAVNGGPVAVEDAITGKLS